MAEILMQFLWLRPLEWDTPLPDDVVNNWIQWLKQLPIIKQLKIPRWTSYNPEDCLLLEIHGYADASKKAYAAVIYLRVVTRSGVTVQLQLAKAKVAPIKPTTIPRLELCAAFTLSRICHHYLGTMERPPDSIHLWSNSKDVLHWLNAQPSKWPISIANRCAEIHTLLPTASWHYVNTKLDSADIASIGVLPSQFYKDSLWFQGPLLLRKVHPHYPPFQSNVASMLSLYQASLQAQIKPRVKDKLPPPQWDLYLNYSNLNKLLRITAYCQRLVYRLYFRWVNNKSQNLKSKNSFLDFDIILTNQDREKLASKDLLNAKLLWLFIQQQIYFKNEVTSLSKEVKSKCTSERFVCPQLLSRNSLDRLKPFLDRQLLRVGGRLNRALLDYDVKHPLILHPPGYLTKLVIESAHLRTLHGSTQLTLATLRQEFWIPRGRQVVKAIINRCYTCICYNAVTRTQHMADLPSSRVLIAPPFQRAGVDYSGPYSVRLTKTRGKGTMKGYIAVFVCMATRAIHLELVEDYSTEAFIAAFHRFMARRGHCTDLYSDRGTNFIGASVQLHKLWQEFSQNKSLYVELANLGTNWHFNPPSAPHFGGL